MPEPWEWRVVRTAAAAMAFGFAVLALLAIAESLAASTGDSTWSLGKPEYVAWTFALLVVPWFLLAPLPEQPWGWGFVRALSPAALTWYLYDLAAGVSALLHHSDPLWVEAVALSLIYAGLVPWASWMGLIRFARTPPTPAALE